MCERDRRSNIRLCTHHIEKGASHPRYRVIQISSADLAATGLEDRPPPPPAPTRFNNRQKKGGLLTRLQSVPNHNTFSSGSDVSQDITRFDMEDMQRGGVENIINNCRGDERKQNLTQSSAHKIISNNVTATSVQQRLHHARQSSEFATKPDVSMTVRILKYFV